MLSLFMNLSFLNKILFNLFFLFLGLSSMFFFFVSGWLFLNGKILFFDWEFFNIFLLKFSFPIYLDFFCSQFLFLVFFISSMIMVYSKSYMEGDKYVSRFVMILVLFIISMMFLIISPNLVSMILGWDGLGLVSYCLVIHYQNFKSSTSGMLTALSNRIGDCFLILSICFFINYNSWNYLFVLKVDYVVVFLIIFISMTKSAQVPFSSWLPAAMAAPTPVSSLVHSSTLVTAGVYLMIRFFDLLTMYSFCLTFITLVGLFTTILAGISANLEFDMKKIIALSTLSQLGIMMSSLGVGFKEFTFFHLEMHAIFKALMFMCSGNFIHLNFNCQDLRFYGGFYHFSCFSSVMFSISNLSLCGFPFLCGFFSKDLIIEMVIMKSCSIFEFFLFMMGICLTILYTFRCLNYLFVFTLNSYKSFSLFDLSLIKNLSMFPLFLFTIFFGYFYSEFYLFCFSLIFLPLSLKLLVFLLSLMSLVLSLMVFKFFNYFSFLSNYFLFLEFCNSMFFFSFLSKVFLLDFSFNSSKTLSKVCVNGWINNFYGLSNLNFMFSSLKIFLKRFSFVTLNSFLFFVFLLTLGSFNLLV